MITSILKTVVDKVSLIPTPTKILAGVALTTILATGLFWKGYSIGVAKADLIEAQYEVKLSAKEAALTKLQVATNDRIVTDANGKIDTIHTRTVKYVDKIREVPGPTVFVHDTAISGARVELSRGWVSLHNASASNHDADTAGITNATASGVTPDSALGFVVRNYAACNENAVQLNALQEWIRSSLHNVGKQP